MKARFGFLIAILFLLLAASQSFAFTSILDPNTISQTVLPNGMEIIVKEDHATPLVAMDVWYKNGSRDENSAKRGVSHFIEHMIFKGTAKRSSGQIDLDIENLGGTLNASTSKDWTHFNTVVSSKYFDSALEIVADALSNPEFPETELEKERGVILEEVTRSNSMPSSLGFALLSNLAYKEHPYKYTVTGTLEDVKKIQREDLLQYFSKNYCAKNRVVAIVGDIKPAVAFEKVKAAFTDTKKPSAATANLSDTPLEVTPEPKQTELRRIIITQDVSTSLLIMGYHAPSVKEKPNICDMDLLLSILADGMQGRLVNRLKSYGILPDQIQTDFLTQKDPGLASVMIVLPDNGNETEIEAAALEEIQKLTSNEVSNTELSAAKSRVLGQYAFSNETYSGQASTLGFYAAINSYKFATDYYNEIIARTPADIQKTASQFLVPENCSIVLLKNGNIKEDISADSSKTSEVSN